MKFDNRCRPYSLIKTTLPQKKLVAKLNHIF